MAGQYPVYHGPQQQPYPTSGINTGYGQRLYPPQHPIYNNRPSIQDPSTGVIYQNADKRPGIYTGGGDMKTPFDRNRPSSLYPHSNNTSGRAVGPIYLASYCDVYLGEYQGEIRSPGYPFGYPVNHTCMYTVKKARDDVCGLELIFHHFDVQTPNTQKDLTDNCYGDYLLLPDGDRLCGYYTQSMSGDYKLKKYFEFPETSEYIFMQFISDGQQTPDGSGFWFEVKQLPNSCKTKTDYSSIRCDRIISGQYSQVDRIYSPGFPQYYGKRQQCVYFIQPMDDKTCEFELDLVQFNLEQPNNPQEDCRKDYLQLPDRKRICGHHKFRRIFQFPKYHDHTSMFYFHSDDQIEDRGYEIVVRQLPNSCVNYNYNTSGQQPQPWQTNVYVPSNDPNIPAGYVPPTPVFTYDNNTGGLQPYQPPLRPGSTAFPNVIKMGPSEFGRKNVLPSVVGYSPTPPPYWMNTNIPPNNLNDPRNVDSSGTIPLFYANGTLATRIPPMKPVDMIPFLKKGKTFVQKDTVGRSFVIHTPQDINAVTFNRIPSSSLSNNQPDEPEFQSSARIQQSPKLERFRSFDQISAAAAAIDTMNIMPVYNCDQTITRPVEYIRSPNFPNNYPVVTRCIYSILKSDTSVCQILLHLLSLDLEYTTGCRNDYLHIESTGEKLCGRFSQPEVRVINYYGYSRDIRLIFNSDREITSSGFEVRIEQIPNSCNEQQQSNVTTLNAMVMAIGRQFQQQQQQRQQQQLQQNHQPSTLLTTLPLMTAVTSSPLPTTPLERFNSDQPMLFASSVRPPQTIEPQALTNLNQTTTTLIPGMTLPNRRICKTTTAMETYFESDNFPLEYPSNLDCTYKIFRSNRNVCRLEIDFDEFNVGDENYFGPGSNNQQSTVRFDEYLNDNIAERRERQRNRPVGECLNDFVEIDGIRYCGQRSGQQVAINFPKFLNEIPIRFISINSPHVSSFNGFRLKIRQIDRNCRKSLFTSRSTNNDVEMEDEFGPAIIES
ncbi:CUB domain containing protein, partial [Euroglyphus maynei]